MTNFVVRAVQEAAQRAIEQAEIICLSLAGSKYKNKSANSKKRAVLEINLANCGRELLDQLSKLVRFPA